MSPNNFTCLNYKITDIQSRSHREITPTAISGPRFHVPLHIFPPHPGPAGVRRAPEGEGALAGGI